MKIVNTVADLHKSIEAAKHEGKTVGFVPTMGALHEGHLSLVKQAAKATDFVVVSVFVNPTQFNNPDDLERYPRTLDADAKLLGSVNCELLFAPTVKEVYPEEDTRQFNFGDLETVMEGEFRPGHFNGVAQVVSRLFDLVRPDKAFFGMKDFQQLAIIKEMVKQLKLTVDIVPCDIVRESDGLAMSSRNTLLNVNQRKNASLIARTLFESCKFATDLNINELKSKVITEINQSDELEVEYFEIVDGNSLQAIDKWSDSDYIVGCIAVFAGEVRLIDNVTYKNTDHEY
nr:pantoate--beta-alanine ligase [uncultured Carboxylicivirga sp.]